MKKKYIALILCAVILAAAVGGFLFVGSGNALHKGRALISESGEFIFIDERNSPIVMGDADKIKFRGVTDGDEVLVLYGFVMCTYPARGSTYICLKLSDGEREDIDADTLNQLREMGWIDKK